MLCHCQFLPAIVRNCQEEKKGGNRTINLSYSVDSASFFFFQVGTHLL